MSKQTSKGRPTKGSRGKKEAAFERHAAKASVQHHEFVGDAGGERAEAEFKKIDRLEQERANADVRVMADELRREAERTGLGDRARRSIREGVQMLRELRSQDGLERLREKARQRLAEMPQPVQRGIARAERLALVLLRPAERGVHFVSRVLKVPAAFVRLFSGQKEA